MPLTTGTRIGAYEIIAPLGAGGMGEVYRARDPKLGREVAIKVLPTESLHDDTARARLLHEARLAATLNHPNICTMHEVGEADGHIYLVMELIEGLPLSEKIAERGTGLATEGVVRYGAQIAAALAHAHERHVIHRDLKSSNVVVTPDGHVKVLDFGLARRVWESPNESGATLSMALTETGAVVGTPHYLAPEVLRGGVADERSDLWALGVLLHEMASGTLPFRGTTSYELASAIMNDVPASLPERVPAGLRGVIGRCLAKEPGERYQRAREVRAALDALQSDVAEKASALAAIPRRGRRGWILVGMAGAALVIVALIAEVLLRRGPSTAGTIRSLAVLPLENISRDPEQEYFVDGMTEELITSLANLEGVRVISRTSSMRYKNTNKGAPQIARELGVDGVIEGSAMRAGDRVRITAQLIDAARDRHVWGRSYERDVKEVLTLQAEVAAAIADEIRAALSEGGKNRAAHARAVDPQAYEDYLKGRFHWAKRNPESFRKAEEFFRRAIARDPKYPAAHAGLADVYAVRNDFGGLPPSETYLKARESVLRALELDDQLAEAHATLGMIRFKYEHDLPGTASALRKALALNPNYATAHQWYASYLAQIGKPSEALAEVDRAQELDPLAPVIRWTRGFILVDQRRYDEAAAAARQALEIDPGSTPAHSLLARVYLARKDYANALAEFDQGDSITAAVYRDPAIRAALSRGDERTCWRLLLQSAKKRAARGYVNPTTFVVLYGRLGERDSALAWLERTLEAPNANVLPTLRNDALDSLRLDPQFVAILKRHGLEP